MKTTANIIILFFCILNISLQASSSKKNIISVNTNVISDSENEWLKLITSNSEKDRFKALNNVKEYNLKISKDKLEKFIVSNNELYIGTLIHYLISDTNPILYQFSNAGIDLLSKYDHYFPNAILYFSRIKPADGYNYLVKLYKKYPEQRLIICKEIGTTKNKQAHSFFQKIINEKILKNKIFFDEAVGLANLKKKIIKSEILYYLSKTSDRETIIALSKIISDFKEKDLYILSKQSGMRSFFAFEYILNNFENNEKLFFKIIDESVNKKNYDFVKQLLTSDKIRKLNHPKVNEYFNKINEKK